MRQMKRRNPSLPDWVSDDIRMAYEIPKLPEARKRRELCAVSTTTTDTTTSFILFITIFVIF